MTQPPNANMPRFLRGVLNEQRDMPLLSVALQVSLLAPAAIVLYLPGVLTPWLGAAYIAVWALVFLDRFTLFLHCVSHRPLFNKKHRWLSHWVNYVLCPLMGQTPHTYFSHHMGMHHKEGNLQGDLSTTMPFQRDRLSHWLRYYGTFLFFGIWQLAHYHRRKGNSKLLKRTLAGELGAFLVYTLLLFWAPGPTLVVFLLPLLIIRTLMMAGNWGQHAFVDPDAPDNDFKSSITCINSRYNRRCFNDGFHIVHHRKPAMHFSEMDREFDENRALYGGEDAIIFDGIDFFQVWLYLMLGKKTWLADRFVQLPNAPQRSREEILALFERRLQPFEPPKQP